MKVAMIEGWSGLRAVFYLLIYSYLESNPIFT